jgi:hypothetical protein
MPAANQAFRFAAAGHPIARGVNELSLGELRALLARTSEPMLIVGPHTLRVVDAAYQARWMLGCLPFLTAAFGASVARRRPIVRVLAAVGFIVAYNAYFVVFLHQQDGGALVSGTRPVWLLVWAPNAMLAVVAGALLAVDARPKPRAPSGSLRSPNP